MLGSSTILWEPVNLTRLPEYLRYALGEVLVFIIWDVVVTTDIAKKYPLN